MAVRTEQVWIPDTDYEDGGYWYQYEVDVPDPVDTGGSLGNESDLAPAPSTTRGIVSTPTPTINVPGATAEDKQKAQSILQKVIGGTLTSQDFLTYLKENPLGVSSVLGGLANLNTQPSYNRVGYQGTIPNYVASRVAVPYQYDPDRRPGSGGRQYFTDVRYTPQTAEAVIAAQKAGQVEAKDIAAKQPQYPLNEPPVKTAAHGGIMKLATGSYIGGLDKRSLYEIIDDMVSRNKGSSAMQDTSYQGGYSQASSDPVQALMAMLGNQTAQTPRPVDAPEKVQDTTPQGTMPALIPPEKPKLEEPVAIPEQLSQEAYHLLHPEAIAPDLPSWSQNKNGTYSLGGGSPEYVDTRELKEPRRVLQGYQNVPLEDLNKYAKAESEFYKNRQGSNAPWNQEEYDKVQNMLDKYSVWKEYKPEKFEEPVALPEPQKAAHGGLMALARGRYLQGTTDGMADKLPASIDGRQPAKLSHGEFVVPADVVSHLGNGNSDAGAKKLYSMMDKIRMARTGTKKQGKQINPDKYMPGGSVNYASGGDVKGYAAGDLVDTTTTRPAQNVYESNLSSWAGPYVTGMLGKGQALSEMPYQAYQGPLTAGASGLQQQAFQTAGGLQVPGAVNQAAQTAGDITGQMRGLAGAGQFGTETFGTQQAQQYMNPYLQASLDPQIAEARRQAQITNLQNMSKLTQAGAYGGGRQAIMQSEADRNLASNLANITGQGYNTAYQQAMAQFNADQARKQQAQQFGATYGLQALQGALGGAQAQGALGAQQSQIGLQNLAQQQALGAVQRGITSEGIAADKAQFEEARDYPYKMLQFQQSLLSGLPLQTQAPVTPVSSSATNFAQGYTFLENLLKNLNLASSTNTAK